MNKSFTYQHKERKAIPLIIKSQSGEHYELTEQAEDLLKKIDKPMSIVSVAGLYRTGKSYLLNRVILDKKSIFGVGPTVNPCTKGLWAWIEPDPVTEKRDMLVIDTEGLGALDEESNHDMKIFCLAVLLSTTFIYNSVGSIDENALQTLSLVLNLVSNIDRDNTSSRPNFIWVVRDFSLQLINEMGKALTANQYLESALISNTKEQQKAMIRKTILNAFPARECFTLVKPLIDEMKLQNLDEIPMDELRPEFVSQSIELRNKIKSGLRPFSLNESQGEIRGRQLILVIKKYLVAINEGAVPNIVDTWTFIKEEKYREALDEVKRTYTERINSRIITKVPLKKANIEQLWASMKAEIISTFNKLAYYESYNSSTQEYGALQQFLVNAYSHISRVNHEEGLRYIKSALTKEYEPYSKKLFSHFYSTYEEFEEDLHINFKVQVLEKHSERVEQAKEHIEKYIDLKLIDNFKLFLRRMQEELDGARSLKIELEQTLEKQMVQITEAREKDYRTQQEKIFGLEKTISLLENEKYQLVEAGKAEKTCNDNSSILLKKKLDDYARNIEELNAEVLTLNTCNTELREKVYLDSKEFQKQRALSLQKEQHLESRIKEAEAKVEGLETKLAAAAAQTDADKRTMISKHQTKLTELEQDNQALTERCMDSEAKVAKLTHELNQMSEEMKQLKQHSLLEKKNLEQRILHAESSKKSTPLERELREENEELHAEIERLEEKSSEAHRRVKQLQEDYKHSQASSQKQIAVHTQQIQFQEIELKDLKMRYDQLKVSYQTALESLQDNSKSLEHSNQLKMFELQSEHEKELRQVECEFEEKEKLLKKELQISQRIVEELQLQLSLDKKSLQNKEKEWKESNSMLQGMCKRLEDKIRSSEKDYEDIFKEKESFYLHRMKQLEQEIEQAREKANSEIEDNKKKSEEALSVLKHYAELEKQQWEKRLQDDRDKFDRKHKNAIDDYEKRLHEERSTYEEEINELQERMVHMERVFNEKLQNLQYDHDIHLQKITNNFLEEKVEKDKRIALVEQELEMKSHAHQQELASRGRQYEQSLQETRKNLSREFSQKMTRLEEAQQSLQEKYESLKKSNREAEQNNLILKNEMDKERALAKEKQKNAERKMQQLENKLENELTTYNQVIENISNKNTIEREQLNREIQKLNAQVVQAQDEKNQVEMEYETQRSKYELKVKYLSEQKVKSKEEYEDFIRKFEITVKQLSKQNKELKEKNEKEINKAAENYHESIKNVEENHSKMIKDKQDRIARLATENKSLKDRLMVFQMERSSTTFKRPHLDSDDASKKYQQMAEQYKALLNGEKEKCRKLKEENGMLRSELDLSVMDRSQISVYERPSFSEIGNSRLSNNLRQTESKAIYFHPQKKENRMEKSATRKYLNSNSNTPLIHQKRSRNIEVEEFGIKPAKF